MTIPTIQTSRLTLRPFAAADAVPLHRILAQEGVLRYFPTPGPPALDRVERLIDRQLRHWAEHGHGWWAVESRASGQLIGWNGLQYLPDTDEVEIGYLLAKDQWGQGLAVEGGRVGLRYGFDTLGLERIIAVVHIENSASMRVAEKLGLTFDLQTEYFGIEVNRYVGLRTGWLAAHARETGRAAAK
ncbi:MAG: GNAT family N-acetyltransferase [Anaerolineae bacterium]|jgi:ribosomal-protein-alanine N-acetyltransferase